MRILFTGGGTGGHFYPIIAVAEELKELVREKKLIAPELFFMAPSPYNESILFEQSITYKKVSAGKIRRYFSIFNFLDLFKTGWGILSALYKVYKLYPDVVFAKGGYTSFPVLFASKILHIPVVIHESDSVPGRVNTWAGKFAQSIAVSWVETAKFFPSGRVAHTGCPVRRDVRQRKIEGSKDFLKIEPEVPVVLVLGGSQGAEAINEAVLESLPGLVKNFTVIHQTGRKNLNAVKATEEVILKDSPNKERYRPYDYLNSLELRMAAGAADVVVSRAGSTIFEIASWGLPSIIIPISNSNGDHQRKNAFAYARAGACEVIEEPNLTSHILEAEVKRIIENSELRKRLIAGALSFDKPDSAKLVASEILKIALSHEIE